MTPPINSLDDAAARVLSIYHELKSKRKSKKEQCMKTAIENVYESWGRNAKYDSKEFRSAVLTMINNWKGKKLSNPAKKGKQLSLFSEANVKKAVKKIKHEVGYESLTFAFH